MKVRRLNRIVLFLLCFTFFQCTQEKNFSRQEYMKYVLSESNGLNNSKTINGLKYTVQFLPARFMALAGDENIVADSVFEAEKEYKGLEYIKLTIENAKESGRNELAFLSDPSRYNYFLQYSNTQFKDRLKLEIEEKSYPCVLSYMETEHKVRSKITFMLGFDVTGSEGDRVIKLNDELFGNGILKFIIDNSDIKKLQTIKLI